MKRPAIALLLALVCGLAPVPGLPERPGPLALIRIPMGPAGPLPVLSRLRIDVRQELETCLLALANREERFLLRSHGVRFSVLHRDAGRREFLIVGTGGPGAFETLRAAGRAVAVEPETAVFWTDFGSAAEAVPPGLPRKELAPRSVLPYVRTRPAATPPAVRAASQDPLIESLVSLVSASNLAATVQTLQDFQTRYASTTNCEAAGETIFGAFSGLGLDSVRFDPFVFSGGYASRNVVAEKTGETYPDDVYIVCAHYDSTSASRLTLAPGADDNASGTAAVLEAARVLAAQRFDFTIRFIAFSAEEWGLWGSRAYAAAARSGGERLLGVINLDMIAFADAPPEDLQLIVNSDSTWLADLFLAAGSRYGGVGGTRTVDASFVYSDHSPFWDNGYPAMLAIGDNPLTNPYYHRTTDTLATLDPGFLTSAARASVGLLAELAQPIKEGYPSTPVGLTAAPIRYSSLFNMLMSVRLGWTAQTDAASFNIYRSNTPHAGYVRINTSPVTGTSFTDASIDAALSYYYAITAVGPTGLESNRSRDADFLAWPPSASQTSISSLQGRQSLSPQVLREPR